MSGVCQRHTRYQQDDVNQGMATCAASHRSQLEDGWQGKHEGLLAAAGTRGEGRKAVTERGRVEGPHQGTEII